ncbi:flagellar biosynthesis protein FlhB [Betaproteobacteria bacterium GR16-43]|nr:flagellar biosynthesis protein FlhB [Betaproteobacteria bacterium GR16-43]
MAETDQEKTLPASEKRLEQAREEGHVPRSRELSGALLMAVAGGLFIASGEGLSRDMAALMSSGLSIDRASLDVPGIALERFSRLSVQGLLAVAPWLLAMCLAALAAPLAIGSWNFSTQGFMPDFNRLNPMSGLGRMFSRDALIELGKAVAKATLVGGIGLYVVWDGLDGFAALGSTATPAAIALLGERMGHAFILLAAGLAAIAAVDVPVQLWQYHAKLRMTPEEAKRESRESEGDPMVKGRIKSLQREMARRRMMAEVPKADVVVVNPTHYAVALKWQGGKAAAPVVVAKGSDLLAHKIRSIAYDAGVTVVDAPPLARALHKHAEVGDPIPAPLYEAVAQVLAYVFQLRRGMRVSPPSHVEVPAGLDPLEAAGGAA